MNIYTLEYEVIGVGAKAQIKAVAYDILQAKASIYKQNKALDYIRCVDVQALKPNQVMNIGVQS